MLKEITETENFQKIFERGSKTFYNSSIFFPAQKRQEVSRLYAFVRIVDDYVDSIPAKKADFYKIKEEFFKARKSLKSDNTVVQSMVKLEVEKDFKDGWMEAFLHSMEMDLKQKSYQNIEDLKAYIYGSADVIGLAMAKILELDSESFKSAEKLGSAFQLINFIRDIQEDLELGRNYFPIEILKNFNLTKLNFQETKSQPKNFNDFINYMLNIYHQWQKEGEIGFKFIPKRYLIPIKTASQMYKWTARTIARDPFIIYKKKVKPSKKRIFFNIFLNTVF